MSTITFTVSITNRASRNVQSRVFLDTSFAVALLSQRDRHHAVATQLQQEMAMQGTRMVTTRAVLIEIGNAFSRRSLRSFGWRFLSSVESTTTVSICEVDASLYARALILFQQHVDKEWSLVDCLSFIVMRDESLSEALTADAHFEQAGFKALLPLPT